MNLRNAAGRPRRPTSPLAAACTAVAVASLCGFVDPAGGQTATPPPADPADVVSVDAIITAVYDVISGPAGQGRDWDRFRSLFVPEARLIPVGRSAEGDVRHRVMTPDEYVDGSGPLLERNGFFENEIGRVTEQFGYVTHLFSSYESRRTPEEEPFARGINSFQLLDDGERWWVVTIFWNAERPDLLIPQRYIGRIR